MLRAFALLCLPLATPAVIETFRLPGGTPTDIGGAILTLTEVQDQRCPPDVDCYWEGLIRLTLTLAAADGPVETIILCNLCEGATREATVAGLTLSMTGLEPSTADLAVLRRPTKLTDYTAVVTTSVVP